MPYKLYSNTRRAVYRSVFLSDFHMGAKAFDAGAVLDFLKSMECEYLFLVGDIVDGWKLKKRWYWTENCNRIMDELLRKTAQGTKIIYLPGNHDDEVRQIMPLIKSRFLRKYGIRVKEKTVHTLLDGRKFLVLHGDQFDSKILKGTLSKLSDRAYDWFMDRINGHTSMKINIDGKLKPFSLAKTLGRHGKKALHLLNNFESAVYKMTKDRGLDGLICGHTHIPVLKPLKDITYANCGCWLRFGHTALVEDLSGKLELLDWPSSYEHPVLFDPLYQASPKTYKVVPDSYQFRSVTKQIVSTIRKTWPVSQTPQKPFSPVRTQSITTRLSWPARRLVYKPVEIY